MKIFAIVPVHNRLQHTRGIVEALRQQENKNQIAIVIVDDGSTDGTTEYLNAQPDVTTLRGAGNLWWAGAVDMGIRHVMKQAGDDDLVLLLNDDTTFDRLYVNALLVAYKNSPGSIVGSVIHEIGASPPLVSIGARINLNRIVVWDVLSELQPDEVASLRPTYEVDALSGRGTLFPLEAIRKYGGLRPWLLPHYLADYELSIRFKRNGLRLLVCTSAVVLSPPIYGNTSGRHSGFAKYVAKGSPKNIFTILAFYMMVGDVLQRATAPVRVLLFYTYRKFLARKKAVHP